MPNTRHKIFDMTFGAIYPMYVQKVEKKGRTVAELDQVIQWLTGYTQYDQQATLEDFFNNATIHPHAHLITGVICGHRVENIEDPLMQKIRYLDKLVDELAKGKAMEKILRT